MLTQGKYENKAGGRWVFRKPEAKPEPEPPTCPDCAKPMGTCTTRWDGFGLPHRSYRCKCGMEAREAPPNNPI